MGVEAFSMSARSETTLSPSTITRLDAILHGSVRTTAYNPPINLFSKFPRKLPRGVV